MVFAATEHKSKSLQPCNMIVALFLKLHSYNGTFEIPQKGFVDGLSHTHNLP